MGFVSTAVLGRSDDSFRNTREPSAFSVIENITKNADRYLLAAGAVAIGMAVSMRVLRGGLGPLFDWPRHRAAFASTSPLAILQAASAPRAYPLLVRYMKHYVRCMEGALRLVTGDQRLQVEGHTFMRGASIHLLRPRSKGAFVEVASASRVFSMTSDHGMEVGIFTNNLGRFFDPVRRAELAVLRAMGARWIGANQGVISPVAGGMGSHHIDYLAGFGRGGRSFLIESPLGGAGPRQRVLMVRIGAGIPSETSIGEAVARLVSTSGRNV